MAFVDATKQEYGDTCGMIESKLNPGALVAIDNVLMSGEVGLSDDDDTFWSTGEPAGRTARSTSA